MRWQTLFVIYSTLAFSGCVHNPPNIVPCVIDIPAKKAYCSPVDQSKPSYVKDLEDLDKFMALSPYDTGTLLKWIELRDQ